MGAVMPPGGDPGLRMQRALPAFAGPAPPTSLSLPPRLPYLKRFFSLDPSALSGLCLLPVSLSLAGKVRKGGAVPGVAR